MLSFDTTTIITLAFIAMFVAMVLAVSALVSLRSKAHRDRRQPVRHRRYNLKRSSFEDSMLFAVSPSCPAVVGHLSRQDFPIMHMMVTPPTPARGMGGDESGDEDQYSCGI
ncbi:hypothetical protein BV22DRAFT_1038622 [Leucogyrophana mollusca]|uniref:Uncharacterized protein n=1 Tax=Leucogyrophana mollusca TaxID=85980 RepID=A0ACB8B8F3_9AGAM|nr:hypothetical protein BV22DRAFT_1038622 [Leucogyrophana mollusca]